MRLILIVPYNTVKNGISRGKFRDLGQIADIQAAAFYNRTAIRLLQTCSDPQQGRFPCAVDTDETHFFSFVDRKSSVVEQQAFCIGFC